MKRLVTFPLEDGSSIIVEVDETIFEGSTVRGLAPADIEAASEPRSSPPVRMRGKGNG